MHKRHHPFLFAALRLTLFLALTSWLIAGSRTAYVHIPGAVSIQLRRTNWAVVFWSGRSISKHIGTEAQFDHTALTQSMIGKSTQQWSIPGGTMIMAPRGATVSISHWTVVVVLLLTYVVLRQMNRTAGRMD